MARGVRISKNTSSIAEGMSDDQSRQPDRSSPDEKLNHAIIDMLQRDGRMAFSEIAHELGVSEGTGA